MHNFQIILCYHHPPLPTTKLQNIEVWSHELNLIVLLITYQLKTPHTQWFIIFSFHFKFLDISNLHIWSDDIWPYDILLPAYPWPHFSPSPLRLPRWRPAPGCSAGPRPCGPPRRPWWCPGHPPGLGPPSFNSNGDGGAFWGWLQGKHMGIWWRNLDQTKEI